MEKYTAEQVLGFCAYMNDLNRVKKENYYLYQHPTITGRWWSTKELMENYFNNPNEYTKIYSEMFTN